MASNVVYYIEYPYALVEWRGVGHTYDFADTLRR